MLLDILQINVKEMLERKRERERVREHAFGLLPISKHGSGYRAIHRSSRKKWLILRSQSLVTRFVLSYGSRNPNFEMHFH